MEAWGKYKVGDRVRFVKEDPSIDVPARTEGVIQKIANSHRLIRGNLFYIVWRMFIAWEIKGRSYNDPGWYYFEEYLELVFTINADPEIAELIYSLREQTQSRSEYDRCTKYLKKYAPKMLEL